MFGGGSQLPSTEIVSLLSEETRKTIAGLCWHCLKMVWLNSNSMNTWQITALRKTITPSCKWVSLWWWGIFVWGQTLPFCIEKWTHRDHIWIQPMSATESLVPFSPLLILWLFHLVSLSQTVSWPVSCWLELRPTSNTHTHTHTLSCATAEYSECAHLWAKLY